MKWPLGSIAVSVGAAAPLTAELVLNSVSVPFRAMVYVDIVRLAVFVV